MPTSQGELIRTARGGLTQAAFAKVLGVDRSCLSRYESEALGAPTSVINFCLGSLTTSPTETGGLDKASLRQALANARQVVKALELACDSGRTAQRKVEQSTRSRR